MVNAIKKKEIIPFLNEKITSIRKKNLKPEKYIEKLVIAWCHKRSWFINVIESKAVYNIRAKRYLYGMAKKGHVDLVGSTDKGQYVAIELKAKGKLSTLRIEQWKFLYTTISKGGFGVVVDSDQMLDELWQSYQQASDKKKFLFETLGPISID